MTEEFPISNINNNEIIPTDNSPEVSTLQQLKLIHVDEEGAYFEDFTGKKWCMGIQKLTWREMSPIDLIRIKYNSSQEIDKNYFETTEDAINYVLKIEFKRKVVELNKLIKLNLNKDEEQILLNLIEKYNKVVKLAVEYENETDVSVKFNISKEIKELLV